MKKQAHLPYVLEETRVSFYIPSQGKQKYQVSKLARKAKFLCLLLKCNIEF